VAVVVWVAVDDIFTLVARGGAFEIVSKLQYGGGMPVYCVNDVKALYSSTFLLSVDFSRRVEAEAGARD